MFDIFISLVIKFFLFGFGLIIIGMVLLYFFQNNMLYVPNMPSAEMKFPEANPPMLRSPSEHNLDFEDVIINTSDGVKLRGWFIKGDNTKERETIIFFQANAGNIGLRLPNIVQLCRLVNVNILIVGYRGYGHSEGIPTEQGLKIDALSVFDWAIQNDQINNSKIYIFGRSLGGAVAIYLCSKRKENIKGLILENTFSSIPDMVDHIFTWLARFKKFILRIEWNSIALIKDIKVPMLFISGRNDQIVPCTQMDNLFEAATKSPNKQMFKIPHGTHNETWLQAGDEYFLKLRQFIDECEGKSNISESTK